MFKIVTDPDIIREALALYPIGKIDLDVEEWLKNPVTILSDDNENLGIFELFYPGVYTGHYFFKCGGKEAKNLAIEMLRWIFNRDAIAVRGLTPTEHRAAVWMTRYLGFKPYGDVDTEVGLCTLFVMTKKEFEEKYG